MIVSIRYYLSVATKASSVTRSLQLATSTSVSTWMGDHQGRPSAENLCPFVGVDINLWLTVCIAVIVLTDVTWINQITRISTIHLNCRLTPSNCSDNFSTNSDRRLVAFPSVVGMTSFTLDVIVVSTRFKYTNHTEDVIYGVCIHALGGGDHAKTP